MDFNEYQREANKTDQRPGDSEDALTFPLLGLATEVGALVNQYKKRVRDGEAHELFTRRTSQELGDVLWYLANLAEKLGLELDEIAQENLNRTRQRWPVGEPASPRRLLDEDWPNDEQLPRDFTVEFREVRTDDHIAVEVWHEGDKLGDRQSDMAWDPDGYRYHDAFHLTYAARLGWSPIVRWMFGRQRESDPVFREIEDSGRAKVIEEGIAAVVFDYARRERFLAGVDHIDSHLLDTITSLVSHLEVKIRTAREWEQTLLRSFEIWRELRNNHGGFVTADLNAGTIAVDPG